MKAENTTTDHNRTIRVLGLKSDPDVPELLITVGYVANQGAVVGKAVALDNEVIPAIIEALNRPLGGVERRYAENKDFDQWGSDEKYPRAEWRSEAFENNTSLGYWDWVDAQYDAEG